MKLEFSRQILEKYSDINFYENPLSGIRVIPCGQTDGHDEANSNFFAILRTRLKTISKLQIVILSSFIKTM